MTRCGSAGSVTPRATSSRTVRIGTSAVTTSGRADTAAVLADGSSAVQADRSRAALASATASAGVEGGRRTGIETSVRTGGSCHAEPADVTERAKVSNLSFAAPSVRADPADP
ncbi:hypothetical protein CCE01nite_08800 [Cellulomonas cellasea]|uniref:Uncharacterized protein n=1 Tax=Cellulomonas cellasea TaxID=43670 RepID=A0A4Y3KR92_9CELL|nr:hypothetical protein CCE01nite_08800 [Cellulomonas cellasea]